MELKVDKINKNFEIWEFNHPKLFWQYPVITEKQMRDSVKKLVKNKTLAKRYIYLAIPWATIIDKKMIDFAKTMSKMYLEVMESYSDVKILTACQHIHFHKIMHIFKMFNVDMLFTTHKTGNKNELLGIKLLAMPLYAVNIEEPRRNIGIDRKADFMKIDRKYWFSFMGAYQKNYLSNIRLNLRELKNTKGALINLTNEWFFEKVVYRHQLKNNDHNPEEGNKLINSDKTREYNEILVNSRFSLCPSGTGPNSIRLWESLAVGAIPVLLSDTYSLPDNILAWKDVIIRIKESDYAKIPEILSQIDPKREAEMRKNCLITYDFLGGENMANSIVNSIG